MERNIKIIKEKILKEELDYFLNRPFPEMIKFVVDIEKQLIALGGEMHADAEQILLKQGSEQKNLWGGNIYPKLKAGNRIEYTSLINIRPSENNRSMEVQDKDIKKKMETIISNLIILE